MEPSTWGHFKFNAQLGLRVLFWPQGKICSQAPEPREDHFVIGNFQRRL